jgi:Flp pilus assembly protein protease CpaA
VSDRTRTAIIAVVTVVWAVNFVAGLAVPHYDTSESINAIFMAIVGGLFALGGRGGGDSKNPPDGSGKHRKDGGGDPE